VEKTRRVRNSTGYSDCQKVSACTGLVYSIGIEMKRHRSPRNTVGPRGTSNRKVTEFLQAMNTK